MPTDDVQKIMAVAKDIQEKTRGGNATMVQMTESAFVDLQESLRKAEEADRCMGISNYLNR
jgi:hypothetical protein